jgi:hypothetical protein
MCERPVVLVGRLISLCSAGRLELGSLLVAALC